MGFPIYYQGKILFRDGKPAFSVACCCGEDVFIEEGCAGCLQDWVEVQYAINGIANGDCDQCTESPTTGIAYGIRECAWRRDGFWPCNGGNFSLEFILVRDGDECYMDATLSIFSMIPLPNETIVWRSDYFPAGPAQANVTLNYVAGESTESTCDFSSTTITATPFGENA